MTAAWKWAAFGFFVAGVTATWAGLVADIPPLTLAGCGGLALAAVCDALAWASVPGEESDPA